MKKEFQFGINEPTKKKAQQRLFKKIGYDSYKWRFEVKEIKEEKIMEKLNGWENANSFGDFKTLKPGTYKCIIKGVEELISTNAKKFVKISFDIADGEFKNYFADKYMNDTRAEKKWSGIWNLFLEGYEPGSVNTKFKGFITSIEKSNVGFIWDWNEQKLTNQVVGIVFRDEEFKADDGSIKSSAKPFYAVPVSDIATVKVPEPKLLNVQLGSTSMDFNNYTDTLQGDDLPF